MKKTIFLLFTALLAGQTFAADFLPFKQANFDALQKAGKPILVDVYADWCPVCKRQEQVLTPMLKEPQFKNLTVLKVDFDNQKEVLRHFKVNRQSTLILFNNGKEIRRSIGETNPENLRRFINLPR